MPDPDYWEREGADFDLFGALSITPPREDVLAVKSTEWILDRLSEVTAARALLDQYEAALRAHLERRQ